MRLQKLGGKGEFLAETRVKLASAPHWFDGVAIDAEKQRLYVLVVGERKAEEEQPVFDPEAPVAADLYAFSTTALEPPAGTTGLLANEKALEANSEEAGVPLLDPHGIAVDPITHNVLILGQQDTSTTKGPMELEICAPRCSGSIPKGSMPASSGRAMSTPKAAWTKARPLRPNQLVRKAKANYPHRLFRLVVGCTVSARVNCGKCPRLKGHRKPSYPILRFMT